RSARDCADSARTGWWPRRWSSEQHFGLDIDTWPELPIAILSGRDDDLGGEPLPGPDVISRGIFWRKETEQRTGGPGDAVDMTVVGSTVRIDVHLNCLPRTDVSKLRLLEIGGNPDLVEGHNRQQLLAGLNVHSNDDGLGDLSVHRCDD